MSFYQEYLKKQKKEGSAEIEKKPTDSAQPTQNTDEPAQNISQPSKEKFSDVQKREEQERRDFISRVKGENIPKPPTIKNEPEENLRISVPMRPARNDKFLIRLIVILVFLTLIGIISLFWYRAILEKREPVEIIREVQVEKQVFVSEVVAPVSLFRYNRFEYPLVTRSNEFTAHFLQYMNQEVSEEAIVKVLFRDQQNPASPTFLNLSQFLNAFSITMPPLFQEKVNQESLNTFIHLRKEGNEAGFAVVIKEMDGFAGMMRVWEDRAIRDVRTFFSLLGEQNQPEGETFTPTIHRQNVIRCLNNQNGFDICYTTVKSSLTDIFVFATSLDTIRTLINSL